MDKVTTKAGTQENSDNNNTGIPKKSLLDERADEYIKESGKIEDYPDEKKK